MLFDNRKRVDTSPKKVNESVFDFYDRDAGQEGDKVRELLNQWVGEVAHDRVQRLVRSLKSKSDMQFQEAFWELYLHHSFLEMEFTVDFEPEIERTGESSLTPDFRLSRGGQEYFVEAVVVNDRGIEGKKTNQQQQLQERINQKLKSPEFMLWMDVAAQGTLRDIRVNELIYNLAGWLRTLDVNAVWSLQQYSLSEPIFRYNQNGWDIRFTAVALEPDQRGTPMERIVGFRLSKPEMIDSLVDPHDIRAAIKGKAKKYSATISAPMIVAVQVARLGSGEQQIRSALFGASTIDAKLLTSGQIDPAFRGEKYDGVWATYEGPRYQSVVAVIGLNKHLEPAGVGDADPVVWLNPWSGIDLSGVFLWPSMKADPGEGRIIQMNAPE